MASTEESYPDISEWYGAIADCINQARRNFSAVVGDSHLNSDSYAGNARDYWFHIILQELEKANYTFNPILTFINSKEAQSIHTESLHQAIRQKYNIWFRAYLDMLNLWNRKIVESIVHLISFKDTDEEDYYEHYLLLDVLKDKNTFADDMRTYYGKSSKTLQRGIQKVKNDIDLLVQNLDLPSCWYIESGKHYKKASFKGKFTLAISKVDQATQIALSIYTLSYAKASKSLHFETSASQLDLRLEDLHKQLMNTWFLLFFALAKLQDFLKVKIQNEALEQFMNVIMNNQDTGLFWEQAHGRSIEKDDLVSLGNAVGKVIQINNKNQFRAFKVKILFPDSKLQQIREDYFPAPSVRLLASKKEAFQYIKDITQRLQYSITDEQICSYLK